MKQRSEPTTHAREVLDGPNDASNLGTTTVDSAKAVDVVGALGHRLFQSVGVDHQADGRVGVEGGVVRTGDALEHLLGLFNATLANEPPVPNDESVDDFWLSRDSTTHQGLSGAKMQARMIPGGQAHWSIHLRMFKVSFKLSNRRRRSLRDHVSPLVGSGEQAAKNTAGEKLAHDLRERKQSAL